MGAEEMAHANWRLDNPPVVDVAVSRRMGLFVVARLAARHGIRVRLRPASAGGLTALVWLPDEVISHDAGVVPTGMRRFDVSAPAAATPEASAVAAEWPHDDVSDNRSAAASAVSAARAPRFAPLRPDLGETAAFSAMGPELDTPTPPESVGAPGQDKVSTPEPETAPSPAFDAGAAPALDAGAAPAFDLGSTPEKESTPTLAGSSLPPASEVSPLPVYGAPTRGERQVTSGSDGGELPFRTPPGQAQRGIIVPPAGSAGEEHRLPIFESVESDWFRRGKHGASRAEHMNNVASGSWTSPADEGWRAAEAAHVPTSGGVTLSGLPKRVPRANLVPGTVGVDTAAPAPARSATKARDRLASFQRGIREGRAAAREGELSSDEDNSGI